MEDRTPDKITRDFLDRLLFSEETKKYILNQYAYILTNDGVINRILGSKYIAHSSPPKCIVVDISQAYLSLCLCNSSFFL